MNATIASGLAALRRCREQLFFFAAVFLCTLLLSTFRIAAPASALLFLAYRSARQLVPVRAAGWQENQTVALFGHTLLGLGGFSFLWLAAGFFTAGRLRLALLLPVLLLLAFWPASKRQAGSAQAEPEKRTWSVYWLLPLLILLVTYLPFRNLGRETERGFAYRAYFSTDYLKQYSLVQSLAQQRFPPGNPYFAGEKLHYYWLPFALPSVLYALTGEVQGAMKAFSFIANYLLLGLLFLLLVRRLRPGRSAAPFGLFLTFVPVLLLSLEGIYLLVFRLKGLGLAQRLQQVAAYNVDALTRIPWMRPELASAEIDTLLRTLLYMPQAAISLAFFVLFLLVRRQADKPFWLQVLLLVFSAAANVLVGLAFFVFFGCDFLYAGSGMLKESRGRRILAGRALGLVLSLAGFVLLYSKLGILAGGNRPLRVEFLTLPRLAPYLILNLGPLLFSGMIGALLFSRREPYFLAALVLLAASCSLWIQGFENDIPLKFALILQVILLLATAELVSSLGQKLRRPAAALLTVLFLLALPTGLIDIANSSDIRNQRFTFYLDKDEAALLHRAAGILPAHAVIQDYPPQRDLGAAAGVSVIPTFLARPTFVGDRLHSQLFLVKEADYKKRLSLIEECFLDVKANRDRLASLGIDYVLWGEPERERFNYVPDLKARLRMGGTCLFSLRREVPPAPTGPQGD